MEDSSAAGGVIVEAIKYLGILTSAILAYVNLRQKKDKKELKEQNIKLIDNVYQTKVAKLKELYDLQHFSLLTRAVRQLFKATKIDRFTVMFVMNGKVDFNYLTVLFDKDANNPDIGGVSPYAKFDVDAVYKKMLKEMEFQKFYWATVGAGKMGDIETYLALENIKCIGWMYTKRIPLDEFNDIVVYCSMSTIEKGMNNQDKAKARLFYQGKILPELLEILDLPTGHDELLDKIENGL